MASESERRPGLLAWILSYGFVGLLLACWLFVTYWHTVMVNKICVALSKSPLANEFAELIGLEAGATTVWQEYLGLNYWFWGTFAILACVNLYVFSSFFVWITKRWAHSEETKSIEEEKATNGAATPNSSKLKESQTAKKKD